MEKRPTGADSVRKISSPIALTICLFLVLSLGYYYIGSLGPQIRITQKQEMILSQDVQIFPVLIIMGRGYLNSQEDEGGTQQEGEGTHSCVRLLLIGPRLGGGQKSVRVFLGSCLRASLELGDLSGFLDPIQCVCVGGGAGSSHTNKQCSGLHLGVPQFNPILLKSELYLPGDSKRSYRLWKQSYKTSPTPFRCQTQAITCVSDRLAINQRFPCPPP